MTFRFRAIFALLLTALATAFPASAQTQVRASLVAADASIQPGRPITVALRLQHKEHWHTYWINPGTGLATSLAWKLPEGWKAGDILWPAPKVLRDKKGNVTPAKEVTSVVVWTNEFGPKKTRIFSTTIGHNNATVEDARYLDLVARGLLWSVGKLEADGKASAGFGK